MAGRPYHSATLSLYRPITCLVSRSFSIRRSVTKIAVTGKGGVGKTTLTALMALRLAERGRKVLLVDADPNTTLAAALGFPSPDSIVPIADMKELISERMGARPGGTDVYFKLNPAVDDLPAKYCVEQNGLKLIVMGLVTRGGAGCKCAENVFLKALLSHILLGPTEDVLVDMEAGLEHLGRGTASAVDGLIVVVHPELRSIETLGRIRRLANDLGLKRCWPVANRVAGDGDRSFLFSKVPQDELIALVPYSETIVKAGRGESALRSVEPAVWRAIDSVLERTADPVPQ